MKLNVYATLILLSLSNLVNGKGGGGRGGGRSGSSEGGRSSSSGGSLNSYQSSFNTRGSTSVSNVGGYGFSGTSRNYYRGGYGVSRGTSYYNTNSRNTYTNYRPTYVGAFGRGYPYGYLGLISAGIIYWYLMPSYAYPGYHHHYRRYNPTLGAYYVPLLEYNNGLGISTVNATAYTDDSYNHHTYWSYSASSGFPTIENAYFATSDSEATPADFYFKLNFWQLIEFDDTDNNGAFDPSAGDKVVSTINLGQPSSPWTPVTFTNKTLDVASVNYYLEATTTGNFTLPNSSSFFTVSILYRISNLQINSSSWSLPLNPYSTNFELSIKNFNFTSDTTKLALLTVLAVPAYIPSLMPDLNLTTPADVATQMKTNVSLGVSIGAFSEGRYEWPSTVSVTNLTNSSVFANPAPLGANTVDQAALVNLTANPEYGSVLALVFPPGSLNRSLGTANISGSTFMDVDVLNPDESAAGMNRVGFVSFVFIVTSSFVLM